jgi:hypothetical protein
MPSTCLMKYPIGLHFYVSTPRTPIGKYQLSRTPKKIPISKESLKLEGSRIQIAKMI